MKQSRDLIDDLLFIKTYGKTCGNYLKKPKYIKWYDYFWPEKLRNEIWRVRRMYLQGSFSIKLLVNHVHFDPNFGLFILYPNELGKIKKETRDYYVVGFEDNIGMPNVCITTRIYKKFENVEWKFL